MTEIARLLDGDKAARLAALHAQLTVQPEPPAVPLRPAVCGECGRPFPPPQVVFRAPDPADLDGEEVGR